MKWIADWMIFLFCVALVVLGKVNGGFEGFGATSPGTLLQLAASRPTKKLIWVDAL